MPERTQNPLVVVDRVSVSFPRRATAALTEVSLRLAPGERVVILGPSGAGKSTVLNTLTGVVPHSVLVTLDGSVTIGGIDTVDTTVAELSRDVGVLAQDPASGVCLPSVEQEIALPLENRGIDPGLISGRIDDALAAVGASSLRERATEALSGGEAQRVALAASLVAEPALLLLDEPTSMLDAAGIASVRTAIEAAVEKYKPAVVLVEHRLDEYAGELGSAGLPSRAIALDASGRVVADGPTNEVMEERAAELHAAGCWLPLDAELQAVFGVTGGLASEPVREGLLRLSIDEQPLPGGDSGDDARSSGALEAASPARADVVLTASGLTVGRPGGSGARGYRGRRPPADEVSPALISDLALELRAGEIVAVLGANGTGKSSLLLTLAGLLEPLAGTVIGTRPGLIFQNPEHQFIAETVRNEVGYGLPAGSDALIDRLITQHRLAHLAEQNPYRLSGGEKRRLSVAAMLAHDRPALLADEPTFGLDRHATITTIRALRAAASAGRVVVFSSHELRAVATIAHRALVIADGRIIADGPVFDVLRDGDVLRRAALELPPLLRWLLQNVAADAGIRRVLEALDDVVAVDFDGSASGSASASGQDELSSETRS